MEEIQPAAEAMWDTRFAPGRFAVVRITYFFRGLTPDTYTQRVI